MFRPSCLVPVTTLALALTLVGVLHSPVPAGADIVTFSGTVSYQGTHSGDTLYVAVIDTVGPDDVTVLDLQAYEVGSPPFSQPYTLQFDNAAASPFLFVASFLDTDGGGVADVGGLDVFGWYDGNQSPAQVSSASSRSGLDFELPRAEIHGTITFAAGQAEARPDASPDPSCLLEGFRPRPVVNSSGTYAIVGLYPGSYCVNADGSGDSGYLKVCYGDPSCASPTAVTLTGTEVRNGVDLDFSVVPVLPSTWGRVKSRYR